jgi:type I restriction enzyme S subunit
MNPDSLLKDFDQISEAPDAVPRLRRFILDLAVRGKLVPQDPKDEPASALLKRIEAEKRRLIKKGGIRNPKTKALEEEQIAFLIPSSWSWTQLEQIGIINPRNDVDGNAEVSFVPMSMIFAEYGKPSQHEVRPWAEIKSGFTHFAEGDVGLAKITPCFENRKSTVFRNLTGGIGAGTTELHIVRPILVIADYILVFLKSSHFIETGMQKMTGTAGQKRVPRDYFAFSPFPLPPLPEQHRIVAKVDELMELCDQLEAAQAKRERRRDRLVAASLHGLNNGASGDELRQNAGFYLNHLPHLTTRLEHIHRLRQTILNLAVRGKLVPQDPREGSGFESLERSRKLKDQLVQERRIRGEKNVEYSIPENKHGIPPSWEWAHVHDVALVQGGKRLPKGATFSKERTQHIYIRVTDMKNGTIVDDDLQFIAPEVHRAIAHYSINKEDLYITIAGTIGQVGRVPSFFDGHNLTENAAKIVFRGLDPDYFRIALSSDPVQMQYREKTKQMAQPKLALKRVSGAMFPMPPLAEQHRIVRKVDELITLCDELKARINNTTAARHQLLEATLHEALSGQRELNHEAPHAG